MDPTTNPTPSPQPAPVVHKQPKNRAKLLLIVVIVLALAVATGIAVSRHNSGGKHKTETAEEEHEEENKAEYIEEGKYAVEVAVTANGFVPKTVKVKPETRVVWNNTDTQPHRIGMSSNSEKPEFFDPQDNIKPNDSNTLRFDKVGTYHLFDTLNPTLTFDVIVAN